MNDTEILANIRTLVDEEHQLRSRLQEGRLDAAEEQQRLESLEQSLNQCWDFLRQRQARRDAGRDPDEATVRAATTVEGYRQ